MRWFKHLTCANRDESLQRLIDEFGLEGYGAYWLILELISEKIDKETTEKSQIFLELSSKNWRKFVTFSQKKFQKYLILTEKLGLFLVKINGKMVRVECPKLLKYRDEYVRKASRKSGQCQDKVRTMSGQTPSQDTETETETETDFDYSTFIDLIILAYHENCTSLPKVKMVGHLTKQNIIDICIDKKFMDISWWESYFKKVQNTPYLIGQSEIGWKATFDWLINHDNIVKIMNGGYESLKKKNCEKNADAEKQVDLIISSIRTVGAHSHPKFDDQITARIVRDIGWINICQTREASLRFLRDDIVKRYNQEAKCL